MRGFLNDFKKFISRGNVLDLAVAVIIGAAFGRIIQSLVNHILMPVVSMVLGPQGFENYKYVITPANEVTGVVENAIYYGIFIQNIIDFVIVALVIFIVVRLFNKAQERANRSKLAEETAQNIALEEAKKQQAILNAAKPTTESILIEIKELLKEQRIK